MLITEKSASRRQFLGSFSIARNYTLFLILILVALVFASPVAAQDRYENMWSKDYSPRGNNHPGKLPSDPRLLAELRSYHFGGNWGGRGCVAASTLKEMVDEYLATPNPAYADVGSSVPGVSVAWYSPQCGTFTYAVGLQNIEHNVPLTPATPSGHRQHDEACHCGTYIAARRTGMVWIPRPRHPGESALNPCAD